MVDLLKSCNISAIDVSFSELSTELAQFLDGSPDAVILGSFGSFFEHVPEDIARRFCDAFRSLVHHRFVWKLRYPEYCAGVENVKILPWIPQNDLLAHDKVRLFITHGGFNSLVEAVYHATPVIVFPIALDQPENAGLVVAKGFGLRMDLALFTVDELVANIRKVLTDDGGFRRKVTTASAILRDRRDTPAERVSHAIEHVIKNGDAHLRTGAFQLSTLEFIMFDIFLAITVIGIALLFVVVSMVYCAYRAVGKCCSSKKILKQKSQ